MSVSTQIVSLTPNPPKSVTLLKSLNASALCKAVCHHNGVTYVGTCRKTVDTIDKDYKYSEKFLSGLSGFPYGITALDNKLYCLITRHGSYNTVEVVDTSGNHVTRWQCEDDYVGQKLCVVSEQLVVPDRSTGRVIVYSLTGEVVKHIACAQVHTGYNVGLCSVGNSAVVVSNYQNGKVFRLNMTTGQTEWTNSSVSDPQGVACYRENYVCVVSERRLTFLNTNTG